MDQGEEKIKIDTENFERKTNYNRYIQHAQPCINITARLDITNIIKFVKLHKTKLNCLLCFTVLQTAQSIKEFHYFIEDDGLYFYKNCKTNAVAKAQNGELVFVDFGYCEKYSDFEHQYEENMKWCIKNCEHLQSVVGARIGTSVVKDFPLVSMNVPYTDDFKDTFLVWGGYEKKGFKYYLNMSLRFHHGLMDGEHAGIFFQRLQENMRKIHKLGK